MWVKDLECYTTFPTSRDSPISISPEMSNCQALAEVGKGLVTVNVTGYKDPLVSLFCTKGTFSYYFPKVSGKFFVTSKESRVGGYISENIAISLHTSTLSLSEDQVSI